MSSILDLTKKLELNLNKAQIFDLPKMDTKLAVDKSGSMSEEFSCGWVDKTIDLFIAAAMKFDDNGRLEMGFFNSSFHSAPDATEADAGSYTAKHKINADGGTNYAPAIEGLANKPSTISQAKGLFGKLFGSSVEIAPTKPAYIGFITDGDPQDYAEFERALDKMDKRNYVQLIAIGNQVNVNRLERSAQRDNVGFMHIPNPHIVTEDKFYEMLCNEELKTWLSNL